MEADSTVRFLAVLEVDIGKVGEGGIAEEAALLEQLVVERAVVVAHDLLDDGRVGLAGLQDDQALLIALPAARPLTCESMAKACS